ncbi:cytochrome P450 [Streptomyces sp. MI02-7b]|uniref:cytochrome P450 family protein n=1 Tax=Streptomyces sp. MI02-7b TaxID=462941 RepID=UPI0029ADFD26|nr:cytochrome P450 [Streptomyces sp. MI02-7b]MDX3075826.1 cytochrome P450 [Streptomyces sp. MI02-7b]
MTTPTPTATGCPYSLGATGSAIQREGAELRALGPAARVVLPGGIPAWSVTDPELIRRLLTSPDVSKDAYQHWTAYKNGDLPPDWPLRIWVDVRNALSAYGDEHRRLRRPLAAAFSPRRVRTLAPQIQAITDDLLDELQNAGPDEVVDLRAQFAWRLPLLVVNRLLGVPDDLHDAFRDAVGGLFSTDLSPEDAAAAPARVYELITELIAVKREQPGDDVPSTLVAARAEDRLSDQELADSLMLIIGAGHETTVNLLDHAAVSLMSHPAQLAMATSGEVSWEQVVEEALRHEAPIATILLRFPVQDVHDEPTGLYFGRGEAIAINYAAAGRDRATHGQDADAFDVTRHTARDHLAFGYGPHLCLGSELARIEARIALSSLFARFPALRLALAPDELRPLPSFISNGHQQIPVVLGPTAV